MADEQAIAVLNGQIAQTNRDIEAAEAWRQEVADDGRDERPPRNRIAELQAVLAEQQAELVELEARGDS